MIYRMVMQKIMLPYHYLASTGLEAKHYTPNAEKEVDAQGNPKSALVALDKRDNRLLYQTAEDYDLLTEEEQFNAFYNTDSAALDRMLHFGAVEEVNRTPAPQQEDEKKSSTAKKKQ